MKNVIYFIGICLMVACSKDSIENDASEEFPGGATTYNSIFSGSYEQPASNLNANELAQHASGDKLFSNSFVANPSTVNPGLGPIFNNVSCVLCHPKNGKSPQPFSGSDLRGLLFRVSIPRADESQGPMPVPGLGTQFQHRAIVGTTSEGQVQISFQETTHTFADGSTYSLRKPIYTLTSTTATIPANMMVSPRIAQQVIGLGLLEAIPESVILAKQDINDADNDGISGKANRVFNPILGVFELGRFGWKANNATLLVQATDAIHQDMGVTSFVFPQETAYGQVQDDGLADDPELDSLDAIDLAFYTQSLAVPKRRDFNSSSTNNGKQIFFNIGCNKCHTQKYTTGNNTAFAFLNNQTFYPYTDLLLHDMGPDLADGRPDYLATGTEWRTPPLWGIGLSELVNGHTNYLHDGRARNLLEAIMWHGGEAEAQKIKVSQLSKKDREDLVKFVGSL
ncbi:MAG: c-type cytochrome [Bacteroidetes bacterium]|nr:c-type cytochrome [Bacteroidota bacterium]